MEFRILGPLAVTAGARRLLLTAPRQQALLVVLLLRANQVVRVERLVDELWAQTPPATADVALRMAISRLRRLLTDAGDGHAAPLLTRPGGYLLQIDPEQLDACRFERLAREGHQALAAGAVQEAAERLRAALALWAGPALADVPATPIVTAEAARLEVARLAALQARIDADMACGRDAEALADLQALAASHPLDEGVCGKLMRALCRAGRQADALAAYQALRCRLVEELGVDPGAELQRLQRAVLTADPALTRPAAPLAGRRPWPAPQPAQLPPDIADFAGRADDVALLCRLLAGPHGARGPTAPPICGIVGTAGVGKTTLAIHVGHRLCSRFRDGQLWADLRGASPNPASASAVLAGFLSALGVDGSDLPHAEAERAALYRSLLADRRVLVVLDNARDAAQVRPLLPGSGTCAVIITGRDSLATLPGVHRLHLDVLTEAEALDLLARIAGAGGVGAEPAAARHVARLCGHLPLALRVAASRLAERPSHSLPWLAGRLADQRRRLQELELQDLSVRSSFALSYQLLAQPPDGDLAARGFRLLGLLEGADVSLAGAAQLLAVPGQVAEATLDRLTRAQLLDQHQPARYRMHDLVRLYAAEQAVATEPEHRRVEAVGRLLRWYVATARRAALLVRPTDLEPLTAEEAALALGLEDRAEALAWFAAERSNLLAAVEQAAAVRAQAPLCVALVEALAPLFRSSGHFQEWGRANRLALQVAQQLGDRRAQARLHGELAVVCSLTGTPQASIRHEQAALRAYRATGDHAGEARSRSNLGVHYHLQGRLGQAIRHYQQALAIARRTGHRQYEAYALANLAAAHRDLGRLEEAVAFDLAAIAIFRAIRDRHGEADATDDLALAHRAAGRYQQALGAHHEALGIIRELADQPREGRALRELAATLLGAGAARDTVSVLHQALTVLAQAGDAYGHAHAQRQLGAAFQVLGDRDGAHRWWQQALSAFAALGAPEADQVRAELAALRQG